MNMYEHVEEPSNLGYSTRHQRITPHLSAGELLALSERLSLTISQF